MQVSLPTSQKRFRSNPASVLHDPLYKIYIAERVNERAIELIGRTLQRFPSTLGSINHLWVELSAQLVDERLDYCFAQPDQEDVCSDLPGGSLSLAP